MLALAGRDTAPLMSNSPLGLRHLADGGLDRVGCIGFVVNLVVSAVRLVGAAQRLLTFGRLAAFA